MRYLFELKVSSDEDGDPVITDHHFTGYMSNINEDINGQMDELVGVLFHGHGLTRWPKRVTTLPMMCRHWVGRLPETFCESNADVHRKGFGYFICSGDTYNRWDQARYELPTIEQDEYRLPAWIDTDGSISVTTTATFTVDGPSFFRDTAWEPVTLNPDRFRWITRDGTGRINVRGNHFQELGPPDTGLPDQ